jgi:hypothetical protein
MAKDFPELAEADLEAAVALSACTPTPSRREFASCQ